MSIFFSFAFLFICWCSLCNMSGWHRPLKFINILLILVNIFFGFMPDALHCLPLCFCILSAVCNSLERSWKYEEICKNYLVVWVPKKLDAHFNKSNFIKFFWYEKADIRDVIRLINFAIMKIKFLAIMKGTQWQAQDTQSIVSMLYLSCSAQFHPCHWYYSYYYDKALHICYALLWKLPYHTSLFIHKVDASCSFW